MGEHIYENPEIYDLVFGQNETDVGFFVQLAAKSKAPILELACGTGRILNKIAANGTPCVGLDLSKTMIAHAKKKAGKLPVEYEVGDMRSFDLQTKKFGLILIAMNSILHLHEREEYESLFARVHKHLAPDGRFVVSVFNPSPRILSRDPDQIHPVTEYQDPKTNEDVVIQETTKYDSARQVSKTTWIYSTKKMSDFKRHTLELRSLFPEELVNLLHYNGFEIVNRFGDYTGKRFEDGDRFHIVEVKKRTQSATSLN